MRAKEHLQHTVVVVFVCTIFAVNLSTAFSEGCMESDGTPPPLSSPGFYVVVVVAPTVRPWLLGAFVVTCSWPIALW